MRGIDERRVRVAVVDEAGGEPLAALLATIDADIGTGADADVMIVAGNAAPRAIVSRHTAVLALVGDEDAADRAWRDGATHLLSWPCDARALRRTLGLAARFTRVGISPGRPRPDVTIGEWTARGGAQSLAIVALTRFEVVNAAFGRAAGDAVLQAAAGRVEAAISGAGGRIVRRRGAEFVIAAPVDEGAMRALADRVTATLGQPFAVGGERISLGSRIGLAQRDPDEDASVALRRSGEALSAAKAGGDTAQGPAAPRGTSLEALAADLHRAFERDEIVVRFQPQATLASGRIVGVEALARWEHPAHGPLGADVLLAAAQHADLGLALSEHIHAVALARVAHWPAELAGLRIALNVTAADLARRDFVERFLARLADSGVARARITAEITESGLIGDLASAAGALARLRGAGCRIAIDDFGTGYSSLAYLQSLPLDYLKIDRRLAQDIAGSERDRVVVRGVIAIARALGLETVAEGVETAEQRALLADEGCTYYQGFLCAAPLDEPALIALISGA